MSKPVYIMLLNDGETFTDISGCMIVRVPAGFAEDVDDIERFTTYNCSTDPDEAEMFEQSIIAHFENHRDGFRTVSYNK